MKQIKALDPASRHKCVHHCLFITAGIVLSIALVVLFGSDGATLSSILSPATMYGQELTDLLRK